MNTATISIGRNVNGVPMDRERWYRFIDQVTVAAASLEIVVFTGTGIGIYEGQEEQSFTVVVSLRDDGLVLQRVLGDMARAFDQESIAYTVGTTRFLTGR